MKVLRYKQMYLLMIFKFLNRVIIFTTKVHFAQALVTLAECAYVPWAFWFSCSQFFRYWAF